MYDLVGLDSGFHRDNIWPPHVTPGLDPSALVHDRVSKTVQAEGAEQAKTALRAVFE
jgi:hypothetical protein